MDKVSNGPFRSVYLYYIRDIKADATSITPWSKDLRSELLVGQESSSLQENNKEKGGNRQPIRMSSHRAIGVGAWDMESGASFHDRPYSGPRKVTEHPLSPVRRIEDNHSITSLAETVRSSLSGGWECVTLMAQDCTNEHAENSSCGLRSMQEVPKSRPASASSRPAVWVYHSSLQETQLGRRSILVNSVRCT